jgi:hypothetical protein
MELGGAFRAVAGFQFEMINAGFFIRGAISVGNAYVDDIAVVGGGPMKAPCCFQMSRMSAKTVQILARPAR